MTHEQKEKEYKLFSKEERDSLVAKMCHGEYNTDVWRSVANLFLDHQEAFAKKLIYGSPSNKGEPTGLINS